MAKNSNDVAHEQSGNQNENQIIENQIQVINDQEEKKPEKAKRVYYTPKNLISIADVQYFEEIKVKKISSGKENSYIWVCHMKILITIKDKFDS